MRGCVSDGTIRRGRPPMLRCRRCQRTFTELDDLDGGNSTVPDGPVPQPFTPEQKAMLNAAGLLMPIETPNGLRLVPLEFR